ncbi:hypothetical protein [Aeromicrobium sp.]|uniref:hypothetical protein n=1 Tax=Aeromicrobium sp. TaxID=1871063 RepID=UPI0030BFFE2F
MSKAHMRSSLNVGPLKRQLEQFEHLPDERTVAALDATLAAAFDVTQEFVHKDTGQLAASGRVSSWHYGSEWGGRITYGGAAAYYAQWEFSREGHHPFDDDPALHAFEQHFEEVVRDALDH